MLYFLITFISIFSALWASDLANAATYWVAKTGSDNNSCAQAQFESTPKLTMSSGIKCLKPGDSLYVKAGTYNEWFNNNLPGGTSWSAPITIAASPGHTVIIRPDPGADRVFTMAKSTTKYLIIDGFILDGTNLTSDVIKITYSSSSGASSYIRIKNSEIKNGPGQGILVSTTSSYNEFINLHIHNNGKSNLQHGLYITSEGNLIEGCTIHDNSGYGVHIYNRTDRVANNNVVRNNKVYAHPEAGILLTSGDGNIAYNNVTWANSGWGGIRVDIGASNTKVYNNVAYNNRGSGIYIGPRSSNAVVKNNLAYRNTIDMTSVGGGTIVSTNLTTDPLFVDASSSDFRLKAGSPAIDQGATLKEVLTDLTGTRRPQGAGYDIGAFEYVTSAPPTPPPASPANLNVKQ